MNFEYEFHFQIKFTFEKIIHDPITNFTMLNVNIFQQKERSETSLTRHRFPEFTSLSNYLNSQHLSARNRTIPTAINS